MRRKWIITSVAILLLVVGYYVGPGGSPVMDEADYDAFVAYIFNQLLPEKSGIYPLTEQTAIALDADGNRIAYIGFSESMGYGGPMLVGTIVEPDGSVRMPVVLQHNETPMFLHMVLANLYQYIGMSASSAFTLGYDLDNVSGATMTKRAISYAVRDSAHSIVEDMFDKEVALYEEQWNFGLQEVVVILLFGLSVAVSQVKKLQKHRFALLCLSAVVLGFWLNRVISITQFSSMFLGFFPSPRTNMLLYIVLLGAILPIFVLGKNLYCSFLCPFCGVQEIAHKISKKNISLGKNRIWFARLRNLLLFAMLMAAMLTANAGAFVFEPFGVIFGLYLGATPFVLALTAAFIVLSFAFRRLWCVGFCPVGGLLDLVREWVNDMKRGFGNSASKK